MPGSAGLDPWWTRALEALAPEDDVLGRNRAITAAYARWYRDHRNLYKWAGAAAFASHRVGYALAPYKLKSARGALIDVILGDRHIDNPAELEDVDLMRRTNTAVYQDVAWAHLAYADPAGGITAVRSGLAGHRDTQELLAGFEAIEAGRLLQQAPETTAEGAKKIWEGNRLLLYHEQHNVIQPLIERVTPAFRVLLTVMTTMDFGMPNFRPSFDTYTSFQKYMELKDRHGIFTRFEDRWYWIENSVLATWRQVDASDAPLLGKIERFIEESMGPTA